MNGVLLILDPNHCNPERRIGIAGHSKSLKYWYVRLWQIVLGISKIGTAAAIPCHQIVALTIFPTDFLF